MKGINNLQFTEWKEKGIAFIFIGLWMVFTYKLIIEPYNEIQNKKKQKLSLEVKVKKAEKELGETEKIYQKKFEENKKEKAEYEIYEKTLLERGFQNSGKMEEYIYQKSKKNRITTEIIGSIEKSGTTEKESKGRVYVPYSITGEEKNILNWVEEIENSEKLVSFTDTPFQFYKNENNIIKINLKISGYILNDTPKEKNEKITEKEKIFYAYNEKEIMAEKNIVEINGKVYMIIKFKSGKRKIFTHGEEIRKDNKQYILKIEDDELYLEK
ncbi:hypothetical protein [Fusobacterium sp.]|uniref:hypothetical protein n=1 Tax=Fusobacterium sp. TaxID=68766 RepID=UPI002904A2D5|nr:hypothetical protein [Fusobacterium sp.]MDU1911005.1 hypothetical protein [Fusobacterium sp.]